MTGALTGQEGPSAKKNHCKFNELILLDDCEPVRNNRKQSETPGNSVEH